MTQVRLSFSNDDAARMLNMTASTPSRAARNLARKDYAQMHNGRPAAQVLQTRGRSASPTNRRAPTRQRSPLPPSHQDSIEPSDSISQISQRVPEIMTKTWIKKSRTGIRKTISDVYEYFETVPIDNYIWYKKDTQCKTPYPNKRRLCLLCIEEGKEWGSTDKSRSGTSSNLWYHLKKFHQIYPPGQEPDSDTQSQTTLTSQGFTSQSGAFPPDIGLEQAVIEWMVDTQQPFDMVENAKWKQMWKVAMKLAGKSGECPRGGNAIDLKPDPSGRAFQHRPRPLPKHPP
jgi:hypothetical protein